MFSKSCFFKVLKSRLCVGKSKFLGQPGHFGIGDVLLMENDKHWEALANTFKEGSAKVQWSWAISKQFDSIGRLQKYFNACIEIICKQSPRHQRISQNNL